MAAGLGFKDFTTGEVLTAADVDGYLMQGVWVFASAAARDAAVTSPQEGNFAYLKDTNVTTYYTGSAWANLDTTGMTNPMTTTGDTIYSSSGSTPARLGIGTTGQVLTVAGGVPSWASPASSGGMTLISTTTLSSTTTTITVSANSYKDLVLVFRDLAQSGNTNLGIRINSISGASDYLNRVSGSTNGSAFNYSSKNSFMVLNAAGADGYGTNVVNGSINFYDANSTKNKVMFGVVAGKDSSNNWGNIMNSTAAVQDTAVISSISVCSFDTFTLSGTALLYGVS
jgi:hypothetical protein